MSNVSFNLKAAAILRECAGILRQQNANPFRANAYARAAQTLESLQADARDILSEEGHAGLIKLPAIGQGLAASIDEIARTGRLSRLDRLRGESTHESLFQAVPGIGPTLARAIHDELHVDTLEALEVAAHDGRLAAVPGIGARRAAAIRAGLSVLLARGSGRRQASRGAPSVDILLDVDREYRRRSKAEKLPKIAPKRFNPDGLAWLPILHTDREKWHFTALFSNTARAHELGRTDDWVVVYYYDADHHEGQNTIVTETQGPMKGARVVRGREAECRAL
ncbi:MAG: DNA-binding protein [Gammaproteobacteria bacterium]|nr:DNA-binding protein [Gammaproteobacteria bacterium]